MLHIWKQTQIKQFLFEAAAIDPSTLCHAKEQTTLKALLSLKV